MKKLLTGLLVCSSLTATAGIPVIHFTALTDTNVTIARNETKQVAYTVKNQSKRMHLAQMRNITGITELHGVGTCIDKPRLEGGQSCELKLEIDGSRFEGFEDRSPRVCTDSSALQCYNPSEAQILKVTIK